MVKRIIRTTLLVLDLLETFLKGGAIRLDLQTGLVRGDRVVVSLFAV
jgi:hypothetical protein